MIKVGIIGYGYVGKALARRISDYYCVSCYEKDIRKVLQEKSVKNHLYLSNDPECLRDCNIYIITVQTPVDDSNKPNLEYLLSATDIVSQYMSKGNIVEYESTVYPGVTENVCGKRIEAVTGFILNKDFFLAYSPERISPGDEDCDIANISKIISASDDFALKKIETIYSKVTQKPLFIAKSIMEAEAAKLLENLQRDVNIAVMNEYSFVMRKLGIDTNRVIEAANTKWNFHYYSPGYVGGHCIGVDTHYFIEVAKQHKVHPVLAQSARQVNENMISNVTDIIEADMNQKGKYRVGVLGLAYKKNIDDIRNSASVKVMRYLTDLGCEVLGFDPLVDPFIAKANGIRLCKYDELKDMNAIVCLVYHDLFGQYEFTDDMFCSNSDAIVIDPFQQIPTLQKYNQLTL